MGLIRVKRLLLVAFSAFALLSAPATMGQEHPENTQEIHDNKASNTDHPAADKEFNVTETILEHIADDHSWHLWGHTTLPLPVILKTDKGLETFSSARLMDEHHAPIVYKGSLNSYKIVENPETKKKTIAIVDEAGNVDRTATGKILDFSITKNVASMFLSVAILLLIFLSVAAAYKKRGRTSAPTGFQNVMETLVVYVRDEIAVPNLGEKNAYRFMPFLLTVFFFIFIHNLVGLVPFLPGGTNVSGNIAFTFTLAIFVFLVVNFSAKKAYWGHIFWMPGVAWPMKLFLAPIEVIGIFTKPISLMIRLFANITAGHILVLSLVCLIFIFKSIAASAVAVPFAVFISCIELLVAFLQAFIFTMLTALYIGMAVDEEHHEDAALH